MAKQYKAKEVIFDPNDLFYEMYQFYMLNKDNLHPLTGEVGKVQIFNQGSGRSGKSFAAYQLIYALCCANNQERVTNKNLEPLSCYVVRKTLKSARETAFKEDFKSLMRAMHDFQDRCVTGENQSPVYDCYGSTIKFIGMDGEEELGKSDIVFYNEILDEDNEERFEDMILRCQKLVLSDWNPKFTYHWVFRWEGRFNTLFTKTTFWDNKFCPPQFKAEIMGRCPWDFSDWDFENRTWKTHDEALRPINKVNEKNGSINKRRWLIYGEGEQCPEAGAIFQTYKWVKEFPQTGFDEVALSIDFGFTNDPTVLGRTGRMGAKLYDECLCYEPTPTPLECYNLVSFGLQLEEDRRKAEYTKQGFTYNGDLYIWCDSSDKDRDDEEYVMSLNTIAYQNGKSWNFIKTSKIGVRLGLDIVQSYDLHFVENKNVKMELENYVWKIIEGRVTNIPIDKLNHCFVGETLIKTINGQKRIDNITDKDLVLTSNGYRKVIKKYTNGLNELLRVSIKFSIFTVILECTNNHKIKTTKEWKQVLQLTKKDVCFVNLMDLSLQNIKEKSISLVERRKSNVLYGNFIMAKYQIGIKYITLILTRAIIALKIYNVYQSKNTQKHIEKEELNGLHQNTSSTTSRKSDHLQKNGMVVKKGLNGTLNTLKTFLMQLRKQFTTAISAVKSIYQNQKIAIGSALTIANLQVDENQELIYKNGNAFNVGQLLQQTNMLAEDFVVQSAVLSIKKKIIPNDYTYDLMVDGEHEYFANNLLVHNCIDRLRYACVDGITDRQERNKMRTE